MARSSASSTTRNYRRATWGVWYAAGLVGSLLIRAGAQPASAACNLIPQTTKTFDSVLGSTNRPYAAPGEPIELRIRPCDTSSTEPTGFVQPPGNYRVTVLFIPQNSTRHAVVLSNDCNFFASVKAACETQLGGSAECMPVALGPGQDIDVVTRDAEPRLSVRFPNTDADVGGTGDHLTLAGPAAIVVTRTNDPLPCDVATSGCRGHSGLVACIDNYFTNDGACGTVVPATPFSHFTALPFPNNYQDDCFFDPSVCTAGATEVRLTTDSDGNLLLPVDWTGILVRNNGIPVPRLLSATIIPSIALKVPGASFLQSYTPEGGLLPPIFEPQFSPNDPVEALRLFGTADAPYTILRLARRSGTFQQCAGGFNDGLPCNAAEDCPGTCTVDTGLRCLSDAECPSGSCSNQGACGPTFCTNNLSQLCNTDGNCPGGECGPAVFTPPPAFLGFGPITIQRFGLTGAGICQQSTLPPNTEMMCNVVMSCPSGSGPCVQYAITAQNPVPLEGLAASQNAFAFTVTEAIDGVDRNGDGDTLDTVLTLRDRSTGQSQALGAPEGCGISDTPPPEGRAVVEISQPPFHFPAVAVEKDIVAFLESEAATNNPTFLNRPCDMNGDSDTFDAILRVFRLGGGELTGSVRTAEPSLEINGRSLVVSNGRVFARRSEAGEAWRWNERVSVATGGAQATGPSARPSISADGRYVAFQSGAPDLVAGDTNGSYDVFVHDRQTGATERVSVATGGAQATGHSFDPSISADGRYVAFRSSASDLVPGDTNGVSDVFVHDRQTGATERVSVATGGAQATGDSILPAISADGRYVAFRSFASDLVASDTNNTLDVFVHDRRTGTTERVSVATGGAQAGGTFVPFFPSISADGRYVAFSSDAGDLVPGDTNDVVDMFVHDRQTGTTERVSVATGGGQQLSGGSFAPSISADGRFVAFDSTQSDLVAGDTNGGSDVFVHDRKTGVTERVSVATGGAQATGDSILPSISADGRYVAFSSGAEDLVPGDVNQSIDVFVHDRLTGTTERITTGGEQAVNGSSYPSISADGGDVAFDSDAPDLVGGDTNHTYDVFVRGPYLADTSDLTGDGDLNDTVLEVLDTTQPSPTSVSLCPADTVSVVAGAAAFLRPEPAGPTTLAKLPNCPLGTTVSGGVDLNNDGDANDNVVHLVMADNTVQNLGKAATVVSLSALCTGGSNAGQACGANRDCPGSTCTPAWVGALVPPADGATGVLQVFNLGAGGWTDVGQAGDTLQMTGALAAIITPEAAQNKDLNRDRDKTDRVIQVYDAAAAKLTNVEQAAEEFVMGTQAATCGTGPLIAFRTSEAAQGNTDLNGDGDTADFVLQVYVPGVGLVNTGAAVTPCRLEACDPQQPYKVLGDTVKFLTFEGDQGKDLNGDGDMSDLILQIFNACTRKTTVVGAVDDGAGSNPLDAPLGPGSVVPSPGQRCMSPLVSPPTCNTDTDCTAVTAGSRCVAETCKMAVLVPPTCNCPAGNTGGPACPDCPVGTTCENDQIVGTESPAPAHDSVLLAPKALTVKISKRATTVDTKIKVKLLNADLLPVPEVPGHRIRLTAQDGTCPVGTVGLPDLDKHTAGAQDNVLVAGGKLAKAVVPLHLDRRSFTTYSGSAPTRCTLLLTASTVLAGNVDPNPRNDVVPVELNVIDTSASPSTAAHESVIASAKPVKLSIGSSMLKAKTVKVAVANADPATETAGHAIIVTASDGDCPPATVGPVTPASVTLPGGGKTSVAVPVTVHSSGFTSPSKKSPARCTAVLTATTNVTGNVEPDASNNTTNLVIDVIDKNDF